MAAPPLSGSKSFLEEEAHQRPSYRKLGLLNGLLIGLALALGAWLGEAIALAQLPLRLQHPSLILGGLLLLLVGSLAGWLSSRWAKWGLTLIIWLLAAVLATVIIIYQPSWGRNLVIWLSDRRFFGLPIYPVLNAPWFTLLIPGFAIFLVLIILAILQAYRLEGIQRELKPDGGMSGRSLLLLLWPLFFVAIAGYVTNDIAGDQSAQDALLVQEAINTGRDYEGDLFQLGLEQGVNYSAIKGVREQMGGDYDLLIGGVDAETLTTFVVANFDNGAWVTCRVIYGQLNYCYDASPPYTTGLASLISGEPVAEDCPGCLPRLAGEWQLWISQHGADLGDNPQIERLAQWGGYVLMRATSKTGDQALECLFDSLSPVHLARCEVVTP